MIRILNIVRHAAKVRTFARLYWECLRQTWYTSNHFYRNIPVLVRNTAIGVRVAAKMVQSTAKLVWNTANRVWNTANVVRSTPNVQDAMVRNHLNFHYLAFIKSILIQDI